MKRKRKLWSWAYLRFWNNNRRLRDIVPKKTEACYEIISWKYIVIDSINHVVELAWIIYNRIDTEKWNRFRLVVVDIKRNIDESECTFRILSLSLA